MSVSLAVVASEESASESADMAKLSTYDVFKRIGEVTRSLHDALRELGYDTAVESAVTALPDARARLGYIATLTGRAADRVLSAAERGKEIQAGMAHEAGALADSWQVAAANDEHDGALVERTGRFFELARMQVAETDSLLTDIILAQDFHDLTGQVLNKVVGLAQDLEAQLVKLLLDASPPEQRARVAEKVDVAAARNPQDNGLAGPVIDAEGRDDIVTSQAQVDDLLESLGF